MDNIKEIVIKRRNREGRENEEKVTLNCITGNVIHLTKHIWAGTYGGGHLSDGYGKIEIGSGPIYFDQIFLTDNKGTEHPFQFTGLNIAAREGHDLTVLTKDEYGEDICLAVLNHSTQKKYFNDYNIRRVLDID